METITINEDGLNREYILKIPHQQIRGDVEVEVHERAKTFSIAGFRTGHVPIPIVRRQIGQELTMKVVNKKINDFINDFVKENNLNIFGNPDIKIKEFEKDGYMEVEIKMTTWPQVNEIDWQNNQFSKIKKFKLKVLEEDIENAHQSLVRLARNFENTDPSYLSNKDDLVVIDFHCTVDGKEFEGNKAQQLSVVIGDKAFIEELENQLVGLKKNQTATLEARFPDDYHNKDLANKLGKFEVKVHDIKKLKEKVVVNDEFAKKSNFDSLDALNTSLTQSIENEFQRVAHSYIREDVFGAISELCEFEIPETVLREEYKGILKNELLLIQKQMSDNNQKKLPNTQSLTTIVIEKKDIPENIEYMVYDKANKRLKLSLYLLDFAKKNNISVSEQELKEEIEKQKVADPQLSADMDNFYKKEENRNALRNMIMDNKTLNNILDHKLAHLKYNLVSSKEFPQHQANLAKLQKENHDKNNSKERWSALKTDLSSKKDLISDLFNLSYKLLTEEAKKATQK